MRFRVLATMCVALLVAGCDFCAARPAAVRTEAVSVVSSQGGQKAHLPVVLVHGLMSDHYAMIPAEKLIHKYMPGTYVKNVKLGEGKSTSFCNMYDQVEWLRRELQNDPQLKGGCNIIAHSQGGLIARYFVERYNKPRVYNYISWGSPQCGVFGTPGTYDNRFVWMNLLEMFTYRLLYSSLFQRYVSFAGYWRDTLHYDQYLKKCQFLPYLNNEVRHSYAPLFKRNICSLQNMVLVASTAEDVVEPVASCHFGSYRIGSVSEIEELFQSHGFREDQLGLRTLHETGRLHMRVAHCSHGVFQKDRENFVDNTLPFLTLDLPDEDHPPASQMAAHADTVGLPPTLLEEVTVQPLPMHQIAATAYEVLTTEGDTPDQTFIAQLSSAERVAEESLADAVAGDTVSDEQESTVTVCMAEEPVATCPCELEDDEQPEVEVVA